MAKIMVELSKFGVFWMVDKYVLHLPYTTCKFYRQQVNEALRG